MTWICIRGMVTCGVDGEGSGVVVVVVVKA